MTKLHDDARLHLFVTNRTNISWLFFSCFVSSNSFFFVSWLRRATPYSMSGSITPPEINPLIIRRFHKRNRCWALRQCCSNLAIYLPSLSTTSFWSASLIRSCENSFGPATSLVFVASYLSFWRRLAMSFVHTPNCNAMRSAESKSSRIFKANTESARESKK